MRTMTSFFSPLAALALLAAPATAQTTASAYARSASAPVAAEAPAVRTVAVYRFTASRILRMPTLITVSDSAGQLVANFRQNNVSRSAPMSVEVMGNDIILQGDTDAGLLTLGLYSVDQPESATKRIGWWSIGEEHGDLRGRVGR